MSIEEFDSREADLSALYSGKGVPESIQKDFKKYIAWLDRVSGGEPSRLFTNQLLSVHRTRYGVNRAYHSISPQDPQEFSSSSQAYFGNEGNITIFLNPEGEENNGLNLRSGKGILFSIEDHEAYEGVEHRTMLKVDFEGNTINMVYFGSGGAEMRIENPKEDLQIPTEAYFPDSGVTLSAFLQGDNVVIEHSKGMHEGPKIDRITVPQKLDWQKAIADIFAPETLADPINANPDLDRFWKDPERIKKALGIQWTKGSPLLS